MPKQKGLKLDDREAYVVSATAFDVAGSIISAPMDKASAEALADNIKTAMKDLTTDFVAFKNVKVVKYTPDDLYPTKEKNDPYDYSILDSLDKIIDKNSEFKIKDEQGKVEK